MKTRLEDIILGMTAAMADALTPDNPRTRAVRIPHTHNDLCLELDDESTIHILLDGKRRADTSRKELEDGLSRLHYAIKRNIIDHLVFSYEAF